PALHHVCLHDALPIFTYRKSPITGEDIPDEAAQVVQMRYVNPRKAEWPQADYIVGNPPFIGAATMRRALGDGYVDAVRRTWPERSEEHTSELQSREKL